MTRAESATTAYHPPSRPQQPDHVIGAPPAAPCPQRDVTRTAARIVRWRATRPSPPTTTRADLWTVTVAARGCCVRGRCATEVRAELPEPGGSAVRGHWSHGGRRPGIRRMPGPGRRPARAGVRAPRGAGAVRPADDRDRGRRGGRAQPVAPGPSPRPLPTQRQSPDFDDDQAAADADELERLQAGVAVGTSSATPGARSPAERPGRRTRSSSAANWGGRASSR